MQKREGVLERTVPMVIFKRRKIRSCPVDCQNKRSLARKYALYVRASSEAVDKLVAASSLEATSEWESALDLAARARLLCNETLDQLQAHAAEHGC